jgi:O-antigen/teichoic acid export membrane protein
LRLQSSNTLQAFWLGIGSLSSFTLAIVSAAILSRYFNKTEYGTYRQIIYVYNTFLVIFSAGLPRVFSYFLPRFSLQQGKDIAMKITKILFLFGIAFSFALFAFSGLIANILKNPELDKGLKIFSVIPMLLLPTLGLEGIFSTYKKTYYIAIYNTITRILMLLFIVLPVILLKRSYEYAIYGWIVVSFISLCIALYFKGLPFKGIKSEKSFLNYKEILKYSLPIGTASLWFMAIKSADQFFISRFFGTEVFADYSNGFIELPFVYMVTAASSNVILPVFSKMVKDKSGLDEMINLWRNTLIKSAVILYPLVVFCMFNAKYIIILIYSNIYEKSFVYFQIALILNFFNIILFSPLMFSIGETKIFSRIHLIFAIATWVIEYLIVFLFNSPVAIALCSVTMAIFRVIVFIIFLSRYFKVKIIDFIPFRHILTLIIHSIIAISFSKLIIYQLLPNVDKVVVLMLTFTMFLLLLIATSRIFKLNYFLVIDPILKKLLILKK